MSSNPRDEQGFSLVELSVVLLIIAVLVGVAIPLLSGGPERGNEKRAQSDLRNVLATAQTIATDSDGLFITAEDEEITAADLTAEDESIEHVDAMPSTAGPVYVNVQGDGDRITLVRQSGSGAWYCISSTRSGRVTFDRHPDDGSAIDTNADCDGAEW